MARLANFPANVVAEAESLAATLENGEPLNAHFRRPPAESEGARNGESASSTGPKRNISDVTETEHAVFEGVSEKRKR